jgi:Protein of unknown function (DUF805).
MAYVIFTLDIIFNIWFTIATYSLVVRRLHDTGRSHWHTTFVYILIYLGYFFAFLGGTIGVLLIMVGFLGGIYPFILMFFKSQLGTNKWGNAPEKHFGFIDASRKLFNNWLDFKSRSRRSEYWWSWLTFFVILTVWYILGHIIAYFSGITFPSVSPYTS